MLGWIIGALFLFLRLYRLHIILRAPPATYQNNLGILLFPQTRFCEIVKSAIFLVVLLMILWLKCCSLHITCWLPYLSWLCITLFTFLIWGIIIWIWIIYLLFFLGVLIRILLTLKVVMLIPGSLSWGALLRGGIINPLHFIYKFISLIL